MAHAIIDEIGQILPPSRNLAETLARAADYATQQSHPEVTLEHLLLALTEDPDALRVMAVSAIEIDHLKGDVSSHLGRLEERSAADGAAGISDDLRQILEASAAAARGRRDSIDGAIVLAAIVGDGRSTAAHLLRAHGLTFEEAIKALQAAIEADEQPPEDGAGDEVAEPAREPEWEQATDLASAPPQPHAEPIPPSPQRHPPGATADEILASARQRVQGRIAPGLPEPTPSAAAADTGQDDDAAAEVDTSTDTGADEAPMAAAAAPVAPAPGSHPQVPWSAGAGDDQGSGPHPAPPAKRPLPPGAIRPELRSPPPSAPEVQPGHRPAPVPEAATPAPEPRWERAPSAPPAPPPAEPARSAASDRESAIDEVLASIRKSSRPAPAAPGWPPVPPPAPAMGGRPVSPPPPAAPPPAPVPAPGAPVQSRSPSAPGPSPVPHRPLPPRPSDHDFFGPPMPAGQPRNPVAVPGPPPPAPPGRPSAGPPRAPLPGLPPTIGSPAPFGAPAAAPPPPLRMPAQTAEQPPPGIQQPAPARPRAPELALGQMVENIPRTMRVGIPVIVEARIARADVKALADGLQGGGSVWRHELTVTKAMSVRLRAPDGGFFIETASPETQWIENTLGLITDDYASWRWSVTPRERGSRRLQLVVSARTVGTDGLAAETALPDQIVNVKVRINYVRTARQVGGWALAAVAGGLLGRFGEDLPGAIMGIFTSLLK